MKYFTKLQTNNAPNNRLQRAALELMKSRSNLLVDDPITFIRQIGENIAALNVSHPRCAPLHTSSWSIGDGFGVSLGGNYTVGFYLYQVREQEASA